MKRFGILLWVSLLFFQYAKAQTPALAVGDYAPQLKVEKWLKGGNFNGLEKGKVYIVDLWATWCVPCIASMPHLSGLQQQYKSDGLEVIGITMEDNYGNTLQKIESFVQKRDSIMNYDVALVPVAINKDSLQGIFVHPWMQQLGYMNLPIAFLIDRNGRIAYIGDPLTMDGPLKQIINNNYNLSSLRKEYFERLQAGKVVDTFSKAIKENDINLAIASGNRLLHSFKNVKPNSYLILAADVVGMKGKINRQLLDIALTAVKRAIVETQFESPGLFDLLASVYAAKGDYFTAVYSEKLAISLSEGEMRENQMKNLHRYIDLLKDH